MREKRPLLKVVPTLATLEALELVPDNVRRWVLGDLYVLRQINSFARSIKRNLRGAGPRQRAERLAASIMDSYGYRR